MFNFTAKKLLLQYFYLNICRILCTLLKCRIEYAAINEQNKDYIIKYECRMNEACL